MSCSWERPKRTLIFGWDEAVHGSKMHNHYASRRDIVSRVAVTSRL